MHSGQRVVRISILYVASHVSLSLAVDTEHCPLDLPPSLTPEKLSTVQKQNLCEAALD